MGRAQAIANRAFAENVAFPLNGHGPGSNGHAPVERAAVRPGPASQD